MYQRDPELQRFIASLHGALLATTAPQSPARKLTGQIMSALQTVASPARPAARRFPVCDLLCQAVDELMSSSTADTDFTSHHQSAASVDAQLSCATPALTSSVVEHAQSLMSLSDSLAWWKRSDATQVGEPFSSGHANATIAGPGGLEERDDVWVGVSLLAPGIDYPVHHHPPEEVYLVLSNGCWNQDNGLWNEPGPGGFVHNPPNIMHAMRSGEKVLLATWCLWIG